MATMTVRCQVLIHRPATQVWNYVAEGYLEHHSQWDPAIQDMRLTSPATIGEGATGVETRRAGTTQRAGFTITDYQPPTRFALRNTSGPFDTCEMPRCSLVRPVRGLRSAARAL